jgi:hypothetical protein
MTPRPNRPAAPNASRDFSPNDKVRNNGTAAPNRRGRPVLVGKMVSCATRLRRRLVDGRETLLTPL